jgi:hypothetical protein
LSRTYSEPVGEIEGTVATIWAEVLKRDRVGRQDNFFELGGHSLMAVRAITRLRRALKTDIAIRDIFDSPVLTDFSRRLARALPVDLPPMQPVDRSVPLPLSFGQQRLWFLGTMPGASEAYHISIYVRLRGQLDREALGLALDRLVTRHEILRTCIEYCDGNLEQKVAPEHESPNGTVGTSGRNRPMRPSTRLAPPAIFQSTRCQRGCLAISAFVTMAAPDFLESPHRATLRRPQTKLESCQ